MNWIKVEDQMPINDEPVIFVTRTGKVCYGYFNRLFDRHKYWTDLGSACLDGYESCGFSVVYDDYETHQVTCWMPMPEAPK